VLKRFRRLPSPALVIASIALILAVGGGSFALAITDKKSDKRIAKRVSNKQITKRAPGLSVNHANSANTANHANSADTAGSAQANNVYFAVINGTGATPTLASGSSGVSVNPTRPGAGTGLVTVNFPVNVDACAVTVTATSGGDPIVGRKSDIGSGASPVIATFRSTTGTRENWSSNVVVVC
jgi:hypothetical protein